MRGRARRAAAGLLAAVVLALVGCTAPPTGSQDALDALAERVGAAEGVDSVTSSLDQADVKDRPDEWIAFVEVGAGGSDLRTASAVQVALGAGVVGADLRVSLSVGAGEGLAPVHLDPRRRADVALAEDLRSLPVVDRVDLVSGRTASLTADADLADAVPVIRPLAPLPDERGALSLSTGTSLIGVDGTRPGAALLARLDRLDEDPGIDEVRTGTGAPLALRASVDVVAEDVPAVAALLAATPDEAADAGTHPRTAFTVSAPGYGGTTSGFLGLPLGSAEPDDLSRTGEPPVDPSETAERIAVGEAGVRAVLESAAAATGVAAEVAVRVEECPDGRGTRVAGGAVVPVFTVFDSPQEPFDAIVAQWAEAGFEQVDRTMGRDYWASKARREDSVDSVSIRGTQEGLSLTATAECVRP
ncbi:hypothetical protein [Rathayibacter sp. SD072]|uniref:hypothetical protein n=1 Tax=Rathayibacter sp. SD072 TaxID=2781731 RepID=UPI001A966514|nr:hypothetical protein [Rathayibacter sp. SD072]MBO0982961.1 hypothetical protein [Rathayibacter sp. SD072]